MRIGKRGVALLLVLTAVVVLTTLMVEFTYDTAVAYKLANNERERLKAQYLAKSAYNFMALELKFDRTFRQIVQSQNLGQYLGANAQLPLCQQFPMSTGLIRAVFIGGALPGAEGEEGAAGELPESGGEDATSESSTGGEEGGEGAGELHKDVSISQEKSAEEFLSFEGDFDAECIDEGTKINLNSFADLSKKPKADEELSPFDQYKQFLVRFLSRPQYELLFKAADVRIPDVVGNIGDWIDTDTQLNDLTGRSGGAERTTYDRLGVSYSVRNGRLLTLLEAYLIDGVVDDWFYPLMDSFTVYGDGRVNVCTAAPEIVEGLIYRYVASTPSLPPLRLEDPEEMGKLTTAISDACALGAYGDALREQVAQALDAAISALAGGTQASKPQGQQGQQPQQQGQGQQQDTGFASYLATEPRFFSLKLAGHVGDTVVRIKAVVDVKEQDPKKWKLMYWRIY